MRAANTGTEVPGKYLLGQNSAEVHRLNMQYEILKRGFGHSDILDLPIDISKAREINILDIATGSGAWILDVARIPEISDRLSPGSINRVKLSACDISDAKFPPKPVSDSLGIHFFEHDATELFPQEMQGQFDLIHISLLCFALTRQGWLSALQNVEILLRPGGRLLIMEYNNGAQLSMEKYRTNNINTYFQTESSVVNRSNAIVTVGAKYNGFIWGFFVHFPILLESTSLKIVSTSFFDNPIGAMCKNPSTREQGIRNYSISLETVSRFLLSQDSLEVPQGYKISTEVERRQVLEQLVLDIEKEGFLHHLVEWIVTKPL